ncbi:MAG: energy transducer TonB [Gammaproteobacteria bacterium]|nr:energy transducer TonB [Gammaproteobacteria bacterium]
MNLVRLLGAGALAIATTFALIFTMHQLIAANMKLPDEEESFKIADVTLPEQTLETEYDTSKPEEPPEPNEPPPEAPEPDFDEQVVDSGINIAAPTTAAPTMSGGLGGFVSEGDYLPIVRVQPTYPRRALQRGIEGHAIVGYTVTKTGTVRDPYIIEAFTSKGNPTTIFNREALKSALKYKYKPRVVDGEPIDVPGVKIQITFTLDK